MADIHNHRHLLEGTYEPPPLFLSKITTKNNIWSFSSLWKSISVPCLLFLLVHPVLLLFSLIIHLCWETSHSLSLSVPLTEPLWYSDCLSMTAEDSASEPIRGDGNSSPQSTDDWDPLAVLCCIQQGKRSPHLVPARPMAKHLPRSYFQEGSFSQLPPVSLQSYSWWSDYSFPSGDLFLSHPWWNLHYSPWQILTSSLQQRTQQLGPPMQEEDILSDYWQQDVCNPLLSVICWHG